MRKCGEGVTGVSWNILTGKEKNIQILTTFVAIIIVLTFKLGLLMKRIITILFAGISTMTLAQDVIVKKDGSTILSRVLEVNTSDIKYKKHSNPNGPTYTLNIADIMAVNYENGDKDTFEDSKNGNKTTNAPQYINAKPDVHNDSLIALYNIPISYKKNKSSNKNSIAYTYKYGMTSSSVLSNKDLEISVLLNAQGSWYNAPYVIKLRNKTDNFIYIDLANCFKIYPDGNPVCYYESKQTTISNGTASGGSIGLGAITNAVGIGGVVGTIANGVSVGGGSNSSASTTYVQQRILTIPPQSIVSLREFKDDGAGKNWRVITNSEVFNIEERFVWLKKGDVKRYDIINYTEANSPYKQKYLLSYSTTPDLATINRIGFEIYVQQVLGIWIESSYSYMYYQIDWEDKFTNLTEYSIVGTTIQLYKDSRKVK